MQQNVFDSVFGKGWNDGVEEINLTGVADGYDNEGLSLAVRKFREGNEMTAEESGLTNAPPWR